MRLLEKDLALDVDRFEFFPFLRGLN